MPVAIFLPFWQVLQLTVQLLQFKRNLIFSNEKKVQMTALEHSFKSRLHLMRPAIISSTEASENNFQMR